MCLVVAFGDQGIALKFVESVWTNLLPDNFGPPLELAVASMCTMQPTAHYTAEEVRRMEHYAHRAGAEFA